MAGHVVVDGSNIATEGRSRPSLAQLDEAVRAFIAERPHDVVTVVVDATFGHRIDDSEVAAYEEARAAGELVSPPAGAIGRGDGFLLQIADRASATVLSNDSFQEFHGQYDWLFDEGRLIGGTPVAGVGWIFSIRTPVRGPKSREAVRKARQTTKAADQPAPAAPRRGRRRSKAAAPEDEAAPAAAPTAPTAPEVTIPADGEVDVDVDSDGKRRRRRRRKSKGPAEPLNDPSTFVSFVAEHLPGSEVEGEVETYASHGAYVLAAGARCYVPLSALGEPPPRSAREMLQLGEQRTFVVRALDTPRRGIELALPGVTPGVQPEEELDAVLGADDHETPEDLAAVGAAPRGGRRRGGRGRKAAAPDVPVDVRAEPAAEPAPKKAASRKKAAAPKKAPTKRAAATNKATAKKAPTPKKAAAKAPPAKKQKKAAAAKAAPAKKAAPTKKAARAEKAAADKAPARGSTTKKAATPKKAAPAKKATAKKGTTRSRG